MHQICVHQSARGCNARSGPRSDVYGCSTSECGDGTTAIFHYVVLKPLDTSCAACTTWLLSHLHLSPQRKLAKLFMPTSMGVAYHPESTGRFNPHTLQDLKQAGVKYVRITWLDFSSITRIRILPIAFFEKLLASIRPGIVLPKTALTVVGDGVAEGISEAGGETVCSYTRTLLTQLMLMGRPCICI